MTSTSSSSCSSYEDDTVITEPEKIVVQQNLANQEVTQNLEGGKEDDDSSSSSEEEEEDEGSSDDEEEKQREGEGEKHTNQKNEVEEKEEEESDDDEEEQVQEQDEVFSTPVVSNLKKRSFNSCDDIVDTKDQQQPNKKPKTIGSDSMNRFGKLWSNKDEIVLLKAMVDYGRKFTSASDYEIILKSIKNSLSLDYTTKQLKNKVDNFAKKYRKLEYGRPKGMGLKFKEPHDAEVYQFLKTYYGGEEKEQNEGDQPSEAIKIVRRQSLRNKKMLNANSKSSGLVGVIADKGKVEDNLEQKRKDLMIAEAEVHSRCLQLISEVGRLMLKASRR